VPLSQSEKSSDSRWLILRERQVGGATRRGMGRAWPMEDSRHRRRAKPPARDGPHHSHAVVTTRKIAQYSLASSRVYSTKVRKSLLALWQGWASVQDPFWSSPLVLHVSYGRCQRFSMICYAYSLCIRGRRDTASITACALSMTSQSLHASFLALW